MIYAPLVTIPAPGPSFPDIAGLVRWPLAAAWCVLASAVVPDTALRSRRVACPASLLQRLRPAAAVERGAS